MLNGRKRLITLVSGSALIAAVGFMPSTPANAEPDISDVQARVDRLYREAEQASERYNDAKLELTSLKRDLGLLKADQGRQGDRLEQVRQQVQDSIIRQYEGQNLSAMGQVVVSDDPQKFLSQLSTMSAYNDMQDQLFDDYATELKSLDIRSDATTRRAAQVAELQKELGAEKATIDEKLSQAKTLLGQLQAKEREEMLSRGSTRTPDVSASGRAGAAIAYAMAQVGKAYVYGAAGPNAFDCSGLTMMAWAQAGVSLPHSSAAQYASGGPRIARSDLQPGDLVFFYNPISHVDIYIGNGMVVGAQNPSDGVRVVSLDSMPFTGAVRPG